jgi:hypothetical protein
MALDINDFADSYERSLRSFAARGGSKDFFAHLSLSHKPLVI